MVIIKLGFLLGLPLFLSQETAAKATKHVGHSKKDKTSIKSSKSKKGRKSKSSRSTKSSKNSRKSRSNKGSKKSVEKPTLPDYAFDVGKPKGFYHIEYTLFPNMEPFHIDILHWEMISKIYFQSTTVTYRNIVKENTIWIPIMLQHTIPEALTEEELLALQNVVIEIIVSTNKRKMSAEAKSEKAKIFFVKAEDIANECYVQAFETDPNIEQVLSLQSLEQHQVTTMGEPSIRFTNDHEKPLQNSIIIQFDNDLLHSRFQKILRKLDANEQVTCKQYIPLSPQPMSEDVKLPPNEDDVNNHTWPTGKRDAKKRKKEDNKKVKTDKKSRASKSKKSDKKSKKSSKRGAKSIKVKKEARIKISGESFLTDPRLCTYRLNEKVEKIDDIFVVLSTYNLTSPDILRRLRPIVIKLKSLRNLPIDFLIEQKFSSIYLYYNIPNIARHITQLIILKDIKKENSKKLKINESHVFFNVALPELSYFASCTRLFIELIGIYSDEPDLIPSIYGSQKSDFVRIPVRPSELIYPKPKSQVLAVACYDLSLLMHSRMSLELTEPFRHSSNTNSQRFAAPFANENFLHYITIEQIHLNYRRDHHPSPLSDGVLLEAETALKVEVILGFQVNDFHSRADTAKYKRLLLIIYDMQMALYILSNLLCYNQKFMKNALLQNYYMYAENLEDLNEMDSNLYAMTGFWIDTGTSVLTYIEGCSTSYCMEIIIYQIKTMNESLCRIYHNSKTYYYERIYKNFMAFGGIYKITVKYDLQSIFNSQGVHCRQSTPFPVFETIKKLQYLLEMQSMHTINQHAIFPTANELISFDMEFGVPHVNDFI